MLTDIDQPGGRGAGQAAERNKAAGRGSGVHDAASEEQWKPLVAETLAGFGGLHVLVNNAGTIARQGIVDTSLAAWSRRSRST